MLEWNMLLNSLRFNQADISSVLDILASENGGGNEASYQKQNSTLPNLYHHTPYSYWLKTSF